MRKLLNNLPRVGAWIETPTGGGVSQYKKIKEFLDEGSLLSSFDVNSYLIESLLYNVPDEYYNFDSHTERVYNINEYLYHHIEEGDNMLEVNEIKYLFHQSQKWTINDVAYFLEAVKELVNED